MTELPVDRLPLVIGVTGHRDLRDQDVPRLEREVAAILRGLRQDYLDGDPQAPLVVLSALAEGADCLVARVALAQGAQLIAPLPMPLAEYRRDFEPGLKPGNLAEFDALFSQAIAAPVMPLHGHSLEEIGADPKMRAEQYRAVGIFIARHCHALLALWDGDAKDPAAGGTAEVVGFKRDGIPLTVGRAARTRLDASEVNRLARASLDASEIGPVIEVVTPRRKGRDVAREVAANEVLVKEVLVKPVFVKPWGRALVARHRGNSTRRAWHGVTTFIGHMLGHEGEDERAKLAPAERRALEAWEHFETLIGLTRKFNLEAAALAPSAHGPPRLAQSVDYLFTEAGDTKPDAAAKARALDVAPLWCRLYAMADALALTRQSQFKRDWKLLFGFGFAAFVCFAIFAHAGPDSKSGVPFLAAYLLAFVVMVVVYVSAVRRQDQERYLDYRALAEALRVAVYWKLLGIGSPYRDAKSNARELDKPEPDHADSNPVGMVAHAYPIKQPNELAWVKICLLTLERLDRSDGGPADRIEQTGHAIARRFWVQGQFAYFKRQGFRHNGLAETIQCWSDISLLLSPFLFVPILIGLMLGRVDIHWPIAGLELGLQHVILMVVGLLPGVAAVLAGYSERLAFKAQARQYDRMRVLFERAYELLPAEIDADNMAPVRALYQELGIEAMKEHAEWVAIYRQRPIEPMRG
jgi:hypothetical protein